MSDEGQGHSKVIEYVLRLKYGMSDMYILSLNKAFCLKKWFTVLKNLVPKWLSSGIEQTKVKVKVT